MTRGYRWEQFRAVLLAGMLLASSIAAPIGTAVASPPGGGSGPPSDASSQSAETTAVSVDVSPDDPPVFLKGRALAEIQSLSNDTAALDARRTLAFERVNGTADDYYDPTRISSADVFRNDSVAVLALAGYANTTDSTNATRAAELIVAADNRSAHRTLTDAQVAFDQQGDQLSRGQRTSTEQLIRNAERAYQRGQDAEADAVGTSRQAFAARARALTHYATAYHQAKLALTRLDRTTEPSVTITDRRDPVRNGSQTTRYGVLANVSDLRPWALENLTVAVNGTDRVSRPIDKTGTAPGENVTVVTGVNLSARVANITVTATESDTGAGDTLEWEEPEDALDDLPPRSEGERGEDDADDEDNEDDEAEDDRRGPPGQSPGQGSPDKSPGQGPPGQSPERGPPSQSSERGPPGHSEERGSPGQSPERGPPESGPDSPAGDVPDVEAPEIDLPDDIESGDGDDANEQRTATAMLKLDGDGLTDRTEVQVLQTDPLNPDSDAGVTDADESGNGVIDGYEDFDGDNLTTLREQRLGTDPLVADTDEDGLSDRAELVYIGTDPLDADTNDDGTLDGAADPDGDGLTNAEEVAAGTFHDVADSDGDDLDDGAELATGTDPMDPDTDDDFLRDGAEGQAPFNTDPLDPDTDDDGVLDGNETYTTTTSDEELGVSVDITGEGDVAAQTTVANGTTPMFETAGINAAQVGSLVNIESDASVEQANITFEYDESAVPGEESELHVYRYNETLQTFLPVNSTVDSDSNTVTGRTSHFSRYVVFHTPTWNDQLTADIPDTGGSDDGSDSNTSTLPVDVVFLLDTSGSMTSNDPDRFAKDAAQRFVGALLADDRAAVMEFANVGTVEQELTTDKALANSTIRNLEYRGGRGGTRIGPSLQDALDYYQEDGSPDRAKTILLLSDGQGPGGISEAETAAERNITVHTIGFGGADEDKLEEIAQITNGSFNYVADASDLPEVFDRVAENTTNGGSASDGDGIPASLERNGIPTGHGLIKTNATSADTDGDGVPDDVEIRYDEGPVEVERPLSGQKTKHYRLRSEPTEKDSDDDGANDERETQTMYLPVINESGVVQQADTSREVSPTEFEPAIPVKSDPMNPDTDGDGLTDGVEYNITLTAPDETRTYENGVTEDHQELIDALDDHRNGDQIAHKVGIIDDGETLSEVRLTDRTDDFDFVVEDSLDAGPTIKSVEDRLDFQMVDGNQNEDFQRTDTWFSNEAEIAYRQSDTDSEAREKLRSVDEGEELPAESRTVSHYYVWDPDTDDDGLTDGQEARWVTKATREPGTYTITWDLQKESDATYDTDPWNPDTDDDGYWDGWIGVYDVGYTDNVILYEEHLHDSDDTGQINGKTVRGVRGDERVDAQVDVHHVDDSDPGVHIDDDGQKEHSTIHVGERHWGTDPNPPAGAPVDRPSPSLDVEVDWVEGYNPYRLSQQGGPSLLTATRHNYALYGINITFHKSDEVTLSELRDICAESASARAVPGCQRPLTAPGLNAWELNQIRQEYHDDTDRLHLFFASHYQKEAPVFTPHDHFIPRNVFGLEGHTGSPTQADFVQGWSPYGSVVFMGETRDFTTTRVVLMEEIGHGLSIGWADDTGLKIGECYSGGFCYGVPLVDSNSWDNTPEKVQINGDTEREWSVMSLSPKTKNDYITPFSIEEIQTVDFDAIPTIDD